MSSPSALWPLVPLHEICSPKQWATIPQSAFLPEGYPVYGANGVIGYYSEFNHEKPTVLITCRGATCGTINLCEAESYVTGNAMALDDLDESRVERKYLVYALRNGSLAKAISGTAQPQITRQGLTAVFVPLPPLEEQRRIADVLDRAEALRVKRRAALAQLDTLTQSIFLDLFGDPIQNPRSFELKEMIDLIEPGRPISYGILMPGPDQVDGVKYVRVVDMKDGTIDLRGIRKTTQTISNAFRRSLLQPGDLLMSIRGHVGRFAVTPVELAGANITQDTARLSIRGASSVFVRECLRTPGFQRWMAKYTKGVAVRGINLGDVKKMPIILPPKREQDNFAFLANAIERLRKSHTASLSTLDGLFAVLQHRAFRAR